MEDYEVDKKGRITLVLDKEGKPRGVGQPDRLIAGTATYDDDGNLTNSNCEEFVNGFIKPTSSSQMERAIVKIDGKKQKVEFNWTQIAGIGGHEEFDKALNFLAANTNVEWSLGEYKNGSGSNNFVLSTSHAPESDYHGGLMALDNAHNLVQHIHSHPNNAYYGKDGNLFHASEQPSGNDLYFKGQLAERGSMPKLLILHKGKTNPY
jgi:hypothetical protein